MQICSIKSKYHNDKAVEINGRTFFAFGNVVPWVDIETELSDAEVSRLRQWLESQSTCFGGVSVNFLRKFLNGELY